jgi:hypothetical protein
MKFALSLGAAFAALTLAASAHTDQQRVVVRHHGGGLDMNIDADDDGWVTRAEASAAADRIFDQLDSNDDGRLDSADHRSLHTFDVHIDGPEIEVLEGGDGDRRVRVIRRDGVDNERIEREVERALAEAERAVEEAERHAERAEREAERAAEQAERHAERAEREAERAAEQAERHAERAVREAERAARDAERHLERHVVVIRGHGGEWRSEDGAIAPVPPVPPVPAVPPHPPMFMMLIANSGEADLNGDGALSREEFRNQHMRFFDASDANGDGRVRYEPPVPPVPPVAPAAPQPPTPPQPPRPR